MSEMRAKETNISDDGAYRGEVVDINTLAIRHTTVGKSPEEVFQTAFRDNNGAGIVGKKYKALKLGGVSRDGYEYILGYNITTGKLRHKTLASTSLDFYGIHTYGIDPNYISTSYYIIRNDTYGNFSTDNVQLTGFVREHFKRKIIYLGEEIDISLVGDNSDEFNPEWWKTHEKDDQPFANTPLIPSNILGDNHTSFLIMDRLGQKFYMSEDQLTFQEAKGYRLNVFEDTALVYEGVYNWGDPAVHEAPTIENTVVYPSEAGKIVFDMPDSLLSLKMDGVPADGVITITAGDTNIKITKDGNIDITSNGGLNITTTDNVVFQGGSKSVAADGDTIDINNATTINIASFSATYAGAIPAGNIGIPIPVGTTLVFTSGTGTTTTIAGGTLDSPDRKEKVE